MSGDVRTACIDTEEDLARLPEVIMRYSSAISSVPTDKFYAMVTEYVTVKINDIQYTCLIDCGSELNVVEGDVIDQTGVPIDFVEMKWSLKGIHGEPERLKGVAKDLQLSIGSRDFPHHFFVTRHLLGRHQIILGQPFLQWYTARLQYSRDGHVRMHLWEEGGGDEGIPPTISLTITKPGDSRNTTEVDPHVRTRSTSKNKRVQIVEVFEDQDEDEVFRR